MTASDRPSVTDNARAEAQRRWPGALGGKDAVPRRAFIAGAEWAAGRAETTTKTPPAEAGATADDAVEDAPGEQGGSSVPPCSPGGRAETTAEDYPDAEGLAALRENAETATTTTTADKSVIERAATVITANTDEPMWSAVVIAKEMASCGLLATARTLPTRDDISDAIEHSGIAIGTSDAEQAADAVLALLRGGA